jgi:hypothetical protein
MNTDIQAKDVKRLLIRVYQRYQSGAITEAQASKETAILNSILKAIEVTDLENRVSQIEDTISVTLNLD